MKSFEQKLLGRLYCFCGGGDDGGNSGSEDAAAAEQEAYDSIGYDSTPDFSMDSLDDDPVTGDFGVDVEVVRLTMIMIMMIEREEKQEEAADKKLRERESEEKLRKEKPPDLRQRWRLSMPDKNPQTRSRKTRSKTRS
jgi:hypothetical protein